MITTVLLAVITLHPDPKITTLPHPYLLHDSNGWAEVREQVEKYEWAMNSANDIINRADKWNVPGVRESLEKQTMDMARNATRFLTGSLRHADGTKVECVIADRCIGGIAEASLGAEKFAREGVGVSPISDA